jgi:cytochrome c peroxidase
VIGALLVAACRDPAQAPPSSLDPDLVDALARAGVSPIPLPPADAPELVELGRLLFFDKVLSGNKDIACSTCHHLAYRTTDLLSVGIGTGGVRSGPTRRLGTGSFLPRNTVELYNKGLPGFVSLFHDGRVELVQGMMKTPAGHQFPQTLTSVLAAQAMFPVVGRDEMRGEAGDTARLGEINELALLSDTDFRGIWSALVRRLLSYPEYVTRFHSAFPAVDSAGIRFEHAALALAAFQRAVFTLLDSPFDRYLAGNPDALSDSAKRGALIFYGKGRCAGCHSGALLTDQRCHNIGVPQLGSGVGDHAPLDIGRAGVTGREADRFAFRTPSLRNVELTGPWMHNGAYTRLDNAIRHYRDPVTALRAYDPSQLDSRIIALVRGDEATLSQIIATLDTGLTRPVALSDEDMILIQRFLKALTDSRAVIQLKEIPDGVPSGLPVFE